MIRSKRLACAALCLLAWGGCDLGSPTGGGGTGVDGLSGYMVDRTGAPVAGAWVKVYPAHDSTTALAKGVARAAGAAATATAVDSVQTSANGYFNISTLANGTYNVVATMVRSDSTLSYFLKGLVFTKRANLGVDTLKVSGTVTLQVQSGGVPIPNAQCFIPGSPYAAQTNDLGACILAGLPPGTFEVVISYPGFQLGVMGDLQVLSGILTQGGLLNLIGIGAPPSVAPTLISPSSITTVTPLSGHLRWHVVPSALAYQVQLATDSGFIDIVLQDSLLTDTTKSYGPLVSGSYYWRVRARNTVGFGPWSTRWMFVTVGTPAKPAALVGHWNFEEASGLSALDQSGTGAHGILTGAGSRVTGLVGKAVDFDGSTHFEIPDSMINLNGGFTLSAWVWQSSQSDDLPVFDFCCTNNYVGLHLWLNTNGLSTVKPGSVFVNLRPGPPNSLQIWTPNGILPTSTWNHVAFTYDSLTRKARLYGNGVAYDSATLSPGQVPGTLGSLFIGHRASITTDSERGAHFVGKMDEIKIYNRALSSKQIDSLAKADTSIAPSPDTTLIASQDAYIVGSAPGITSYIANANENYGKTQTMPIGVYDRNTVVRTLIQFQIPTAATSGKITKAVLRLKSLDWVTKNVAPDSVKIRAHKVLRAWKEGNGSGGTPTTEAFDGVTALERYWGTQDGSEDWNQKLVGLDDVDASSATAGSATRARGYLGYWEIDLTDLAKFWADSPSQNFGVILEGDIAPTDAQVEDYPYFYTREYPGADSLKPSLILTVDP